jgi:hypothetical protein
MHYKHKTNLSAKYTREAMYVNNITFKYVHVTTVAVGQQYVLCTLWMCVSTLNYPACKMHAPYYQLQPARVYNIFPRYFINDTLGGGGAQNIECEGCFLTFSTTFAWNISRSTNWVRYDQKCILVFMQSTCHSCQIWIKLEFPLLIF